MIPNQLVSLTLIKFQAFWTGLIWEWGYSCALDVYVSWSGEWRGGAYTGNILSIPDRM